MCIRDRAQTRHNTNRDNLVKLVSPDRTIDTETTTLLMRLSWIVGLPDYDVAYAANKQTYWEAVSRRLSDLGNW